ncbi:MAG: C_GCAxxG_C_C family protein [Chloroflexi bacterium]|nr:C_GCAxxG_C_C family protein [Chloroflexota bacterium]
MTTQSEIVRRAGDYMRQGYHCSEAILMAVGEFLNLALDENVIRASSGFAGGVGRSRDLCGAISGGVMLIGIEHGRTSADQNDDFCQELSARFHQRFVAELGSSQCAALREQHESCAILVEQAARILIDVLEEKR